MCGFAGVRAAPGTRSEGELRGVVERMGACVAHRGPDGHGLWSDAALGVALSHHRLAVVDLTAEGKQPMVSACGRWVLALNGEIYDHRALRRREEAHGTRFRGTSDTEVLLARIARIGLEGALAEVDGMFALALLDRNDGTIHLARDRFGEKPLLYAWAGDDLVFGSDLRALLGHPGLDRTVDRSALTAYLAHKCVPGDRAIVRGIRKVAPGTIVTARSRDDEVRTHAFWDALAEADAARAMGFAGAFADALDLVEGALQAATAVRRVADVPVGAFLSGGVDSAVAVALLARQSVAPVRTYTVGFEDAAWDERAAARATAAALGTDHTELVLTESDMAADLQATLDAFDEPFGDSSQLPTAFVARVARRSVTVAITGDGGDELFAGYHRHHQAAVLWPNVARIPRPLRRSAARALLAAPEPVLDGFAGMLAWLPGVRVPRLAGQKAHKLARALPAAAPAEFVDLLTRHWIDPSVLVVGEHDVPRPGARAWSAPGPWTMGERIRLADTIAYLPDDVLVKVDRATMAVALESRTPYLNANLFAATWSLPTSFHHDRGGGKRLLRALRSRLLPDLAPPGPKAGFGIPLAPWLRGALRPWAEALVHDGAAFRDGLLEPAPARAVLADHLAGTNRQYELWTLLAFLHWYEGHVGGR